MKSSEEITQGIIQNFRCFGGDQDVSNSNNPITHALENQPAQFAAGVDVKAVVDYLLSQVNNNIEGETPEEKWDNLQAYFKEQTLKIDTLVETEDREGWYHRMMHLFNAICNKSSI